MRRTSVTTLVGQLNLDWSHLRVEGGSSHRVRRWASAEVALRGLTTLPELEAAVAQAESSRADRLLLALLRQVAQGDDLAARTVLQLMLGKVVRMARSQRSIPELEEAEAAIITALYEVIVSYPVQRRPRRVAANLALTALQRVHRAHHRQTPPSQPLDEAPEPQAPIAEPTSGEEVRDLLAWAVSCDVLSAADADLLARVYHDGAPPGPALAAELGITWPALRQRCSRSVRRLAAAAASYPDRPPA